MNEVLVRGRPAVILLAEDNDNDVELTKLGFRRAKFAIHFGPGGRGTGPCKYCDCARR